jgi:hypothetical protein
MIVPRCGRRPLLVVLALFSAVVSGCTDGKPSVDTSLNEATVTGVVILKGAPVKGGTILFNPSNHARQVPIRTAPIGDDGKYTIKTYTGDNQVTFGGDLAKNNMGIGLVREYASVQRGENEINFDLSSGGKRVDFDLSKKANPRPKKR